MFMQGGIPVSRHPWWYNATESCTTLVRSQAWIWCFLVMKAMSVDLSIGLWWFMLRDKRHCLHVLWFEPGNATCNNPTPSKYSTPCARTQYQCNITYKHINSIGKLHLHCATLLSLSNSRMQNPEHDCVEKCMQLLCCWVKLNLTPECNETTPEC